MDYSGLLIVVAIIIIILVSKGFKKDSNTENVLNSWINHNKNELLEKWGPPTTYLPMDNGGQIWSYHSQGQTSGSAYTFYPYTLIKPPKQWTSKTHFYINNEGIIYSWRYERN